MVELARRTEVPRGVREEAIEAGRDIRWCGV